MDHDLSRLIRRSTRPLRPLRPLVRAVAVPAVWDNAAASPAAFWAERWRAVTCNRDVRDFAASFCIFFVATMAFIV